MVSVKVASVVGAVALFATVAHAADLPQLAAGLSAAGRRILRSGWYLRGDIGMTNQQRQESAQRRYDAPGTSVSDRRHGFRQRAAVRPRRRLQFNNWLRADITGEYRGKANFHGSGHRHIHRRPPAPTTIAAASPNGCSSPTPMSISAPGGASRRSSAPASARRDNTISSFRDRSASGDRRPSPTRDTRIEVEFRLGRCMPASPTRSTPSLEIEFAYRYVSLGDATTGDMRRLHRGTNARYKPMELPRHLLARSEVRRALDA